MTDALREVTVNGVRYFRAKDVERWHRGWQALTEHADELEEANARLRAHDHNPVDGCPACADALLEQAST